MLSDPSIQQVYLQNVTEKYEELPKEIQTVEEEWEAFKKSILTTAKENCGQTKRGITRRKITPWWNDDVKAAVKEKKRRYQE